MTRDEEKLLHPLALDVLNAEYADAWAVAYTYWTNGKEPLFTVEAKELIERGKNAATTIEGMACAERNLKDELKQARQTIAAIDAALGDISGMTRAQAILNLMLEREEIALHYDRMMEARNHVSVKLNQAEAEVASLKAQLAAAEQENRCDVCAGTGKPISGLPCMCGGSGKKSDAVDYLREELVKAETEVERWKAAVIKYRKTGDLP